MERSPGKELDEQKTDTCGNNPKRKEKNPFGWG